MTDISTPVGRLVQGKLAMQQRTDTKTRQPIFKDAAKTIPDMGTFFSIAFPKIIPTTGQPNAEFAKFYMDLVATAAAAWPQFFPQGAQAVMGGGCSNPKFSWKYQDGDGVDTNGQSVAEKPGFRGHHIIKFDTNYPFPVFNEGQFAPHQELQKPEDIVKRGYWIRVIGEAKSNMADLSQQQVPGIALYPKLVSFVGGAADQEIKGGPDAQAAFSAAAIGWRPDGLSAIPGAPVGAPGALMLPTPPQVAGLGVALPPAGLALPGAAPAALTLPTPTPVAAAPSYTVRPDLAAQGHTMASLAATGTVDQLLAAGYITVAAPAALTLPTPPAALVLPSPVAASPTYVLNAALTQQGATIEALIKQGWTHDALVQAGHASKIG